MKKKVAEKEKIVIPIWEKLNLTIEEASAYSCLSVKKLRALCADEDCDFVIKVGNRKIINRKRFEKFMEKHDEL